MSRNNIKKGDTCTIEQKKNQASTFRSFLICAQDMCIRQAQILNTKSSLVEEAANELINMLLEFDHSQRDEEEKAEVENHIDSKAVERNDSEGMSASFFLFCAEEVREEEDEEGYVMLTPLAHLCSR